MLEGAKSMGAGAATIASAGAAVGIGNVFSSLIHSVARNPSLAKQFFWSCLFLFTPYVSQCTNCFFKVYILYLINARVRRFIICLKFLFGILLFVRASLLVYAGVFNLCPLFGVLPIDMALLQSYLSQPYQDPEWIEFVHEQLRMSPPAEFSARLKSFMDIELCTSTREQIIEMYKGLFFSREDPLLFIPELDLDLILRAHLEPIEFNHPALCEVLRSLCQDRHDTGFYYQVLEQRADEFGRFWEQSRQNSIQLDRRNEEWKETLDLQERVGLLERENSRLKERLRVLGRPPFDST